MAAKLNLLGNRVLVQVEDEPTQTEKGIYLPESAQEKPQRGKVVEVGPGQRLEDGSLAPIDLKKGDTVIFAKYGGTKIKLDGREYLILDADSVYAKDM